MMMTVDALQGICLIFSFSLLRCFRTLLKPFPELGGLSFITTQTQDTSVI